MENQYSELESNDSFYYMPITSISSGKGISITDDLFIKPFKSLKKEDLI